MLEKKRMEKSCTFRSVYSSPDGFGGVVASDNGLVEVFLPVSKTAEELKSRMLLLYPGLSDENALTGKAAEMLWRYFSGQNVCFDLPLDLNGSTEFRRAVYEAVSRIPYGSVKTYAEIAAEIRNPKASRGIGSAMAANLLPIIIPCHRVIGSNGQLTGFSAPGGTDLKAKLLLMEGVCFEKGGNKVKR